MSGWSDGASARISREISYRVEAFRRWAGHPRNLVHLSVLFIIPILMGIVSVLSNTLDMLPYLMFPPLASGSYYLFNDPGEASGSPRRFVGGLTTGALCGWIALTVSARFWYQVPPGQYQTHATAVAVGLFLTGAVTWIFEFQEGTAYSTALLVHVTGTSQIEYVLSVFLSSGMVAIVYIAWRRIVYEQRGRFLYDSIREDDHALVPMTDDQADATAMLASRIVSTHDASKVVLLDVVDSEMVARAERKLIEQGVEPEDLEIDAQIECEIDPSGQDIGAEGSEGPASSAKQAICETVDHLEGLAEEIETKVEVPCEVIVAVKGNSRASTIQHTAQEADCDLITIPYEKKYGGLSPTIRRLFDGNIDVLVHQSHAGRTRWRRIMVPIARTGGVAHSMIDFATRLAPESGQISLTHCISTESKRRRAEDMLAEIADQFTGRLETRVAVADFQTFLSEHATEYDLVIVGSSGDRSAASRFVSPPTFERLGSIETDVAIVDRNMTRSR